MTTKTQMSKEFINDLQDLLSLDYAAVEAYEAAIDRFTTKTYKNKFQEFEKDHKSHIKNITKTLKEMGEDYPTGPGLKKILTQGKVILAHLAGDDGAILTAMKSNELQTTESYKQINSYKDIPSNIKKILSKGYEDEKKHLSWIKNELSKIK